MPSFSFRSDYFTRKDLVRLLYFLVELLTVFISSFLVTGKLKWLAVLHIIQHGYYFLNWDQTHMAKKIVTGSSLDWFKSHLRNNWELDSILLVLFDIVVYLCMSYYLGVYLTTVQVICSLIVVQAGVMLLYFGPYYAWASPNNIPKWIEKRIHPDKIQ